MEEQLVRSAVNSDIDPRMASHHMQFATKRSALREMSRWHRNVGHHYFL